MPSAHDSVQSEGVFKPLFFYPGDEALQKLFTSENTVVQRVDRFTGQLAELVESRSTGRPLSADEIQVRCSAELNGRKMQDCGVWVYYPWNRTAVHILEKNEFVELRTNRNRNKITAGEQEQLERKRVGIVGLSVGRAVAITLVQERIVGEIRLADMDTLELSNLNRIRVGLDELGMNKAISAAREIAMIDPFVNVQVFSEGLQTHNIDDFFTNNGKLDLLIEECDSVDIKILSRQKAKELCIPVVMDTSDRGMIDVERFDLEPERKLLHGWIEHLDLSKLHPGMSNEEKIPYLLPMLGAKNMSPRMKASALEIGHTLHTWPQLATSVNLGGAVTADITRRILLGGFKQSGRWYVDIEELIADPQSSQPAYIETRPDPITPIVAQRLSESLTDRGASSIPAALIHELIRAGAMAPSAGNMQPWHFHVRNGRIVLVHDRSRSHSAFDRDDMIANIGLGACIANILEQGLSLGIALEYELFPGDSEDIVAVIWNAGETNEGHLGDWIGARVTDRTIRARRALSRSEQKELLDVNLEHQTTARYYGDDIRLSSIAACCGSAEQLRAMNPVGHHELFHHELRWTPERVAETRDGLDIDTLELNPVAKAGMLMASDYRAISLLKSWNQGNAFRVGAEMAVNGSHGVILISAKGRRPEHHVVAGMSAERVWLNANALGYSVHPVSAPIFLTHHNELQNGALLSKEEQEQLQSVQRDLKRLFELPPGEFPVFMMRIGAGGQPSKRSLRRPLMDMLSYSKVSVAPND